MKKFSVTGILLTIGFIVTALLSGCSSAGTDVMETAKEVDNAEINVEQPYVSVSSQTVTASTAFGGHKVIQSFELNFETDQFDKDISYIAEQTSLHGGYAETSSITGKKPETYREQGRNAYFVLRIPAENAEPFFEDMKQNVGELLSSAQRGNDITEQYFDTETRLNVLKTQLERLTGILMETDDLTDLIELENEIARVNLEIESLTTELRRWDGLVDYAAVTIHLSELALAEGPANTDSIHDRMTVGLRNTLNGMGVFGENLLVFLVSALPVIVLLAAIAVIAILAARRGRRKRIAQDAARKESEKKPENYNEKGEAK